MITVIIPIYNNGTTLDRCIKSIISQSYDAIDIIIINDGSIDNSRDIYEAYSKEYDNISIINTAHIGVSGARNIGLKLAKGEYIAFCDADDIYLPDAFINMRKAINNADIAIGNVIKRNAPIVKDSLIDTNESISRFFSAEENRILGSVYGKLFKRDLIGEMLFDNDLSIGEDSEFLLRYLFKCKIVSLISAKVYHHIENLSGVICSAKKNVYESAIIASKKMINYIIEYQDKSHLDEAIQDLFNIFALILLRIRDVSWGTRVFALVKSILSNIGIMVKIKDIYIYSSGRHYRKVSTIFNDADNKDVIYCIQWPASLVLAEVRDGGSIPMENVDTIETETGFFGKKQYFIIELKDFLASSSINDSTYLGVAHFDN